MKTPYACCSMWTLLTLLSSFVILHVPPLQAQVQIRDTALMWQYHEHDVNPDYSLATYSTEDTAIEGVVFTGAKVIENELIRLTIVPDFGARVISFVYKPTGYEYLYQSECGSPYGIGQNNVYYRWLMTYGGIFPTFPGPQHGKAWLVPWQYSVIKQTADTLTIRMQYTDSTEYAGAPAYFFDGFSLLTCQVDISVYRNSSIWDFDVRILNDRNREEYYEYWTCTTLAPGSDIGDTGTPLNSQIVTPSDQYSPGWSEDDWMLPQNRPHFVEDIDYLDKWQGRGVALISALNTDYWGVINQDRKAGVFRLSEKNMATPTLRVWSWGRDNIDNDLFDFSNGGADNYLELWAGVSSSFFNVARIEGNTQNSWRESYCPTVDISTIDNISRAGAIELNWEPLDFSLSYELNLFQANQNYSLLLTLNKFERADTLSLQSLTFSGLGLRDTFSLDGLNLPDGVYTLRVDILDQAGNVVLTADQSASFGDVLSIANEGLNEFDLSIIPLGEHSMQLRSPRIKGLDFQVFALNGQEVSAGTFQDYTVDISFPGTGLYLLTILDEKRSYSQKVLVRY